MKGSNNLEDVISPWGGFSAGKLLHVVLPCSPAEQGANFASDQQLGTVVTVVVATSESCCCSTAGFPADTPCGSNTRHTPKPQVLHSVAAGCTGAVGVRDHVQCVHMMAKTSVT